jgi:hypothetical protein
LVENIKAIETNYKGYKFRSRLEARWAVFFDSAQIPWEYEPEGYVLSDGRKYLPDFYLPSEEIFVEVKGVAPNDDVYEKLKRFSIEKNTPILLVLGVLDKGGCEIFLPHVGRWQYCFLGVHPRKELIFLHGGYISDEQALDFLADDYKRKITSATNSAVTAMKSARFEFL